MKTYPLLDENGRPYQSHTPGTLGGYRRSKIYGRLDCPSAQCAIAKGQYVQHLVFFADEEVAVAAGYRSCGSCLRPKYRQWLTDTDTRTARVLVAPGSDHRRGARTGCRMLPGGPTGN